MGGRGGTSGISPRGGAGSGNKYTGLDVTTKDGETIRYYFTKSDGVNYYQRGVEGMPEPTPMNMSAAEFRKRVESNGAIAKPVTSREQEKDRNISETNRKETDRFLNTQWYKAAGRPRKGWKGH